MKKNNKWVTLVEVIIASVFFTIIFTWLYSWTNVISNYVKESNIKLSAMNIAKTWIEKFENYKNTQLISYSWDSWSNFISNNWVWYYTFSWSNLVPNTITESQYNDFVNWEWPLDEKGILKDNAEWKYFYRVVKLVDFEVDSTDWTHNIFSCNVEDNNCDNNVTKVSLSDPYISSSSLNNDELTINFSTWTVFDEKGLFIVYFWDWTVVNNFWSISSSEVKTSNWYNVYYLTFSSNPTDGTTITLNWQNFVFWNSWNVKIWADIDESIFNLKNEIVKNLTDYTAYIFYPNKCSIFESLMFYNINTDTQFWLPSNCNDIIVDIPADKKSITLKWNFISDKLNNNVSIIPNYRLKISLWDIWTWSEKFEKLSSLKSTNFGSVVWKNSFSSIYLLWVKVIWFENWKNIWEEIYQKYIADL